jgi:hypothetical protein
MPTKATKEATKEATVRLPKPVRDRIRRYAEEGWMLRARREHDVYLLLAVTNWQFPVVLLRSPRDKFVALRSAAFVEWTRAAQGKRTTVRVRVR